MSGWATRLKEAVEDRFARLAARTSVATGSFWAFGGAVQLKLDELIAAADGASNRLIDIENLSERELTRLFARYQLLATTSAKLAAGAKTTVEDDQEDGSPTFDASGMGG